MSDADLWYVMLADGDVHRVTLDQLDEAFQAGHIDQETLVLAAGARQWTALGALAGLDETPPPPKVPVTNSFRPVSVDLTDIDIGDVEFRPARSKKWLGALSAMAVVGTIVGVALNRPAWAEGPMTTVQAYVSRAVHRAFPSTEQTATASQLPAQEPVAPSTPPVSAPTPPAAAAAALGTLPQSAPAANPQPERFSPDMKQKLLDADKQRDLKAKARVRTAAPATSHLSAKDRFGGFTTGGNKFDPLNSAIP